MALGTAAKDPRSTTLSTMVAGMPDSQTSEKRESSHTLAGHPHRQPTVATSTMSPQSQESKSAQTLADTSSDVYPMASCDCIHSSDVLVLINAPIERSQLWRSHLKGALVRLLLVLLSTHPLFCLQFMSLILKQVVLYMYPIS